jgi:hypothetical protein
MSSFGNWLLKCALKNPLIMESNAKGEPGNVPYPAPYNQSLREIEANAYPSRDQRSMEPKKPNDPASWVRATPDE